MSCSHFIRDRAKRTRTILWTHIFLRFKNLKIKCACPGNRSTSLGAKVEGNVSGLPVPLSCPWAAGGKTLNSGHQLSLLETKPTLPWKNTWPRILSISQPDLSERSESWSGCGGNKSVRLKGQGRTRADVRGCGPAKVREDDLVLPLIFTVDTGLAGEIGRFFSYFCSCLNLTFHFVLK